MYSSPIICHRNRGYKKKIIFRPYWLIIFIWSRYFLMSITSYPSILKTVVLHTTRSHLYLILGLSFPATRNLIIFKKLYMLLHINKTWCLSNRENCEQEFLNEAVFAKINCLNTCTAMWRGWSVQVQRLITYGG